MFSRTPPSANRCPQDLLVEVNLAVLGDLGQIPDPGLVIVQIGGANPEATPLVAGGRYPLQRFRCDVFVQQRF
jgi:hypothetical protein